MLFNRARQLSRLTAKVLALCVFQKPHTLVQSTHAPSLLSPDWAIPCDMSHVFELIYLGNAMFDSIPDPPDNVAIIPNDSTAISCVCNQSLMPCTDVDHGLLPFSVGRSFSGLNKLITFGFSEGIIDDDSVQSMVFLQWRFTEIDLLNFQVGGRLREEVCWKRELRLRHC